MRIVILTAHNNTSRTLLKLTLPVFILSLYACASKPPPVTEISSEEPIIVGSEQIAEPYEPPVTEQVNEPYEPEPAEPMMDTAMNEESSGIAPPDEDTSMMEPPMEPEPIMETMNEAPVSDSAIGAIPSDYYAVQIVAASSEENMLAFATKHALPSDLTTSIVVDGKEWHVLLLGTYPSLAEAKEALAGAQGKFTTSPWIRKVGSLH